MYFVDYISTVLFVIIALLLLFTVIFFSIICKNGFCAYCKENSNFDVKNVM